MYKALQVTCHKALFLPARQRPDKLSLLMATLLRAKACSALPARPRWSHNTLSKHHNQSLACYAYHAGLPCGVCSWWWCGDGYDLNEQPEDWSTGLQGP